MSTASPIPRATQEFDPILSPSVVTTRPSGGRRSVLAKSTSHARSTIRRRESTGGRKLVIHWPCQGGYRMILVYRGNFLPDLPPGVIPWSTETHVAGSLELLGHKVIRIQEDKISWTETIEQCRNQHADLFLWTSTFGMAHQWDQHQAWEAVKIL